jgi:hypothetical protein
MCSVLRSEPCGDSVRMSVSPFSLVFTAAFTIEMNRDIVALSYTL